MACFFVADVRAPAFSVSSLCLKVQLDWFDGPASAQPVPSCLSVWASTPVNFRGASWPSCERSWVKTMMKMNLNTCSSR
eukprot:s5465_g5.t1